MRRKRFALAAVLAAVVALLAVGSGAAIACPGTTSTINGIGSSLQRVAQERVWAPSFHTRCAEVEIRYEALGSGEGFRAWHAEGGGLAGAAAASGKQFIATDDPPSRAQVEGLRVSGEGQAVQIVPVAQAAVSVIAKPPTGCAITRIKNEELEQIFRHVITDWERVTTATETLGGRCASSAITRVVRLDTSGTTYQFKHYLWLINNAVVFRTGRAETERTWLQLQGAETAEDNLRWPEEGANLVRPAGRGGGELVRKVETTEGSIGYASITDSFGNAGVRILRVLNGRPTGEPYAEPVVGNESNCEAVRYKNRLGEAGGAVIVAAEIVENLERWGEIYGSNPTIGATAATRETWPICTLTWDVGYREYLGAGFTAAIGRLVGEYVRYIVEVRGQERLGERHYGGLPAAIRTGAGTLAGRIS